MVRNLQHRILTPYTHDMQDDIGLVKLVRGLDQSGPGAHGENLQTLWKCLKSNSTGNFHAAEESSLRWLLKSMNGTSSEAESLRRYPLAWQILGHVFKEIPTFSLAKSLADRRFIAVLQQTLKDVSQPITEANDASKRKPRVASTLKLEVLRTKLGCLETGKRLFKALEKLLKRVENLDVLPPHDRMGAEHIRSFFCTSSLGAMKLLPQALGLLHLFINEEMEGYEFNYQSNWASIVFRIWDFHLQGSDDVANIGTHLFTPIITLRHKLLESLETSNAEEWKSFVVKPWLFQMENFLQQNFIIPSRAAFINSQDFGPITMALEVSAGVIDKSAPGLYSLIASTPSQKDFHKLRDEWGKQIFKAVDSALQQPPGNDNVLKQILDVAIINSMPVDVEDLRLVCRRAALNKDTINWDLLAACAKCNHGIFQTSNDGIRLLTEVCEGISQETFNADLNETVSDVIRAILDSYRTARDFAGFLKLFYRQLCHAEDQNDVTLSYWLHYAIAPTKSNMNESMSKLIETDLSPLQLLEILKSIGEAKLSPQALCIFCSIVAQGIRSEPFVDAVDTKLYELIRDVKLSKKAIPLAQASKWRVITRTVSWVAGPERDAIWGIMSDKISKQLRKSAIASTETFESFKCCCQCWLSMYPDDAHLAEPADIIEDFMKRFREELSVLSAVKTNFTKGQDLDPEVDFITNVEPWRYLEWFVQQGGRLSRLSIKGKTPLLEFLPAILSFELDHVLDSENICRQIIENEMLINNAHISKYLIDFIVGYVNTALEDSPASRMGIGRCMALLLKMPTDAFGRSERESVVGCLVKQKDIIFAPGSFPDESLVKLFQSLLTRTYARPTFNDEFQFHTLSGIATALGYFYSSYGSSGDWKTALERLERFATLARSAVKQMGVRADDDMSKAYFKHAADTCKAYAKIPNDTTRDMSTAFHLTLLNALLVELSRGVPARKEIIGDAYEAAQSAANAMMATIFRKVVESSEAFTDIPLMTNMLAMINAATLEPSTFGIGEYSEEEIHKFISLCGRDGEIGEDHIRAWKIKGFLHRHFAPYLADARPRQLRAGEAPILDRATVPLLEEYVESIILGMTLNDKMEYFETLITEYAGFYQSVPQLHGIKLVLEDLIGSCPQYFDSHG